MKEEEKLINGGKLRDRTRALYKKGKERMPERKEETEVPGHHIESQMTKQ